MLLRGILSLVFGLSPIICFNINGVCSLAEAGSDGVLAGNNELSKLTLNPRNPFHSGPSTVNPLSGGSSTAIFWPST
jgi:hypothetical protein